MDKYAAYGHMLLDRKPICRHAYPTSYPFPPFAPVDHQADALFPHTPLKGHVAFGGFF